MYQLLLLVICLISSIQSISSGFSICRGFLPLHEAPAQSGPDFVMRRASLTQEPIGVGEAFFKLHRKLEIGRYGYAHAHGHDDVVTLNGVAC